jgi:hypothetical protein
MALVVKMESTIGSFVLAFFRLFQFEEVSSFPLKFAFDVFFRVEFLYDVIYIRVEFTLIPHSSPLFTMKDGRLGVS